MQDQGLAAVGLLPPLRQKERREGVLSRTQQGSPIEKATLRGATAFYGGTASLLQPSRKEARRENTPSFTLHPSMSCWSYPLAEPPRGQRARKPRAQCPTAPGAEGSQGAKGQFPAQGDVTSISSHGLQSSALKNHRPLETKVALGACMGLKAARIRLGSWLCHLQAA